MQPSQARNPLVVSPSNHEPASPSTDKPALSETPTLRQAQDERQVEGLRTSESQTRLFAWWHEADARARRAFVAASLG